MGTLPKQRKERMMHGPFEIVVINEPDYDGDDRCHLELGVELRIDTATVGRAYLGGVESDSEEYIGATIKELTAEALADAKLTYLALRAHYNSAFDKVVKEIQAGQSAEVQGNG